MSEGKIFIRERKDVKEKSKKPRFRVVAVEGLDLEIKTPHIGRKEAEEIASKLGAEVVYLAVNTKENEERV